MTMISTYDAQGRYLSVGSKSIVPAGMDTPPWALPLGAVGSYEGAVDLASQYHDLASGQPVNIPPKPGPHHVFDYTSKIWRQDFALAEAAVRQQRDQLIGKSDWTTLADVPLSEQARVQWATYRQALRDVTGQTGFPLSVIWPAMPD